MRLGWRHPLAEETLGAGVALRGRLWVGDGTAYDDGRVVVDSGGVVTAVGAAADVTVPYGALEVDAAWVGPGIVDRHVHLAFGSPEAVLAGAVVEVHDLGAPPADAMRWRALAAPRVRVAGPVLTAPGGYPSRSWGADGFAGFVDDAAQAQRLVAGLAEQVDVVKLALEPRGGPVPEPDVCAAVVAAAHAAGRRVTVHALTVAMVERALDAGADELAHTPVEPLPAELVARIRAAGVEVVSTLHTHGAGHAGDAALANAAALVAAGVPVHYGTDLGNTGIRPGADVTELSLLDRAGLGPDGALRAATIPLRAGELAGVVALPADPLERLRAWQQPRAVVCGTEFRLRA